MTFGARLVSDLRGPLAMQRDFAIWQQLEVGKAGLPPLFVMQY
jgi:hypothetical protein